MMSSSLSCTPAFTPYLGPWTHPLGWRALMMAPAQCLLVRMSTVAAYAGCPETFCTDGKNAVWRQVFPDLWGALMQAQKAGTYAALVPLTCGLVYKSKWGNTGFEDPNSWCSVAQKLLGAGAVPIGPVVSPPVVAPAVSPAVSAAAYYGFQTGARAANYSIVIGNDLKQVNCPENQFPDGVCSVIPIPGQSGTFLLTLAEQCNYLATNSSAFYENVPTGSWTATKSLGSWDQPFPYPNSLHAGALWLFATLPCPTNLNRLIGCLHGEGHAFGTAPPCFKSLLVCHSDDMGVTWSTPQTIISAPGFSGDFKWGGSGDPVFVYDAKQQEYRAYFFSAEFGAGLARSKDPNAAAGTWEVWMGGNSFAPALNATGYKQLPISAGNPSVFWSQELGCWMMCAGVWGDYSNLTFSTSNDGYNWGQIQTVPWPNLIGNLTPCYPTVIDAIGGSLYSTAGSLKRVVFCDSRNGRKMMSRSIQIVAKY